MNCLMCVLSMINSEEFLLGRKNGGPNSWSQHEIRLVRLYPVLLKTFRDESCISLMSAYVKGYFDIVNLRFGKSQ